jgi:hypothetical protein
VFPAPSDWPLPVPAIPDAGFVVDPEPVPKPGVDVLVPPLVADLEVPQMPTTVDKSLAFPRAEGVEPQFVAWDNQIALVSRSKTASGS